jgi:photosystem II stability/assembly factor-like uncharacterized protein
MRSYILSLLTIATSLIWLHTVYAGAPSTVGTSSRDARDIRAFHPLSGNAGWILKGNNLFWTDSGGTSWRKITPSVTGSIQAVEFLDMKDGWVVAVESGVAGAPLYSLAVTDDGGVTWEMSLLELFAMGDVTSFPAAVYLDRLDAATGWITVQRASGSNFNQGALFQTTDGGETWSRLFSPNGNPAHFVNANTGWIAGGPEDDDLYRTLNGGSSWENQQIVSSDPQSSLRYHLMPPMFDRHGRGVLPVLASSDDFAQLDIYITNNTGDSWEYASSVTVSDFAIDSIPISIPEPEEWLLITPQGRVISTNDRGAHYIETAAVGLSGQITELQMVDSEYGWALQVSGDCTPNSDIGEKQCSQLSSLLQTDDGGLTWCPLNLPGGIGTTPLAEPPGSGFEVMTSIEETTILQAQGFDKCEIATQSQLTHWYEHSPYEAINLYIGGSCRSCANSALTASYLSQLKNQGWKFIPTWVGPQSDCWTGSCSPSISNDSAVAYNQGVSEADAAIVVAIDLGLAEPDGSGAVIYYDLEAYQNNSECREAAKAFISGWTARLQEYGSTAGVYGSACTSYISDFNSITNPPDAVWLAHWIYDAYNESASVWDVACISNDLWSDHQRIRQYTGGHDETWGTVTLNIDSDVIDGVVSGCTLAEFSSIPTISTDGSSVTLTWEHVAGVIDYNVYRDEAPYFTPDTPYATTTNTTWTDPDPNAIGDPAANHYYVVRAVNDCGESGTIYYLGSFNFGLTSGVSD